MTRRRWNATGSMAFETAARPHERSQASARVTSFPYSLGGGRPDAGIAIRNTCPPASRHAPAATVRDTHARSSPAVDLSEPSPCISRGCSARFESGRVPPPYTAYTPYHVSVMHELPETGADQPLVIPLRNELPDAEAHDPLLTISLEKSKSKYYVCN